MSTETDIKLARYKEVAREADDMGRVISVRRLRPSEQIRITEMSPLLEGNVETSPVNGATVQIPRRAPFLVVASVCMIDDMPITFPRNRGELDAILDRLDNEGLAAAIKAYGTLAIESEVPPMDAAKNL
jgi:hypothetical protein